MNTKSSATNVKGLLKTGATLGITDKIKNSTTISAQSISVGGVTYYVINSTGATLATNTTIAASVSEVVDSINAKAADTAKTAPNKKVVTKAFASMDEALAQMKKDLGADVKSIVLDAETHAKDTKPSVQLKVNTFADLNNAINVSLHVGADSAEDNKIDMSISNMSARGLGVNGLDLGGDTDTKATKAIDTIGDAIKKVSAQRSSLGAVQNRLEHTIKNLDNVVENTTSAESQIRDTDMATQMVEYSKNQILSQAGQSMLAQANQSNQGVLSLLQ